MLRHGIESPFPIRYTRLLDVTDEICKCGHLRSEHDDHLSYGHGPCAIEKCNCELFTWKKLVTSVARGKAKA